MTFTPAELRLLSYADRGADRFSTPRRKPADPDGVGCLSYAAACSLHEQGLSLVAMAEAAGCSRSAVTVWRRRHGLARGWQRRGTP